MLRDRPLLVFVVVVAAVVLGGGWAAGAGGPGEIAGRVADASDAPVAGAVVVVCDAASGIPLDRSTGLPLTRLFALGKSEEFSALSAVTDAGGRFTVVGVPEGTYRLVAQSWTDARGAVTDVLAVNGAEIRLHGTAGGVRVPSPGARGMEIRPLGECALRLEEVAPNDDTLAVVSTAAPGADPILGFAGWAGPFLRGMIGASRVPGAGMVIRGLPEGRIHVALFANDDLPGFGAASAGVHPGATLALRVPFVAPWSDARHDPPPRLAPLVAELRGGGALFDAYRRVLGEIDLLPGKGGASPLAMMARLAPHLAREVEAPDGRRIPLGDLAAAEGYFRLQDLAGRRKGAKGQGASYEASLRDLYSAIAARYPMRCLAARGIDWVRVGEEIFPRAAGLSDERGFGLLCLELTARLGDSRAVLLDGSAKAPAPPLPRFDPGLACLEDDRGLPVVYHVARGGPAERAGVHPGMTVTSIDGRDPLAEIARTMERMARYAGESGERHLRYDAFRRLGRRGARGEVVRLGVVDPDGASLRVALPAELEGSVPPSLPIPGPKGGGERGRGGPVSWRMLPGGIGYLRVASAPRDLAGRLDEAARALAVARGVVVDVRGSRAGVVGADRDRRTFTPGHGVAILLDEDCMGAPEAWAARLVERTGARGFGRRTAGSPFRRTTYPVGGGLYRARFPVKPGSGSIGDLSRCAGLVPDVELRPSARDLAAGRDTVLEAARRWLLGRDR